MTKTIKRTKAVDEAALEPGPNATPPAAKKTPTGKLGLLVDMLRRPDGATVADLSAATGWQIHSVRGAMSGALKKGCGLTINSEKADGVRVYRLADGAA